MATKLSIDQLPTAVAVTTGTNTGDEVASTDSVEGCSGLHASCWSQLWNCYMRLKCLRDKWIVMDEDGVFIRHEEPEL